MKSSSPITVILLEDEENIRTTLADLLVASSYQVTTARCRTEALAEIAAASFDLALLDVNLPDGTGFQVAEALQPSHTAILFLTAMSSPDYRVRGLQLGAEDYIIKPFHFQELLLRMRNALKRRDYIRHSQLEEAVVIGKATIHFARFTVQREGEEPEKLTAKEAKLLRLLYERRGKVVSRDEILNHIWSQDSFPTARTVDNFILRLRKMVEHDSDTPQIIQSIRGVGYQLTTLYQNTVDSILP
jgi:two-component system alkaline phosphatase synthesis response regulator PhoP